MPKQWNLTINFSQVVGVAISTNEVVGRSMAKKAAKKVSFGF